MLMFLCHQGATPTNGRPAHPDPHRHPRRRWRVCPFVNFAIDVSVEADGEIGKPD